MTGRPAALEYRRGEMRLAGDRWEEGGERGVVVLLHGGGQTRHTWDRTAARLARAGWTAITLDARGHGDSTWDRDGNYDLDVFADDLVGFVATLRAPPVLVGASLGGMTSILAAGERPGLARALVLVDVVIRVEPAGVRRIHRFMSARPDGFASLDEVADSIAAYNPHRSRPATTEGLRKNLRLGDDGRWRWHWDPAFIVLTDEPRRFMDVGRLERAARCLAIPTLLVRGQQSDVVSDDGVSDLLRLVPQARTVNVRGTGHMVAGDDNDVFTERLVEFLETLGDVGLPSGPVTG